MCCRPLQTLVLTVLALACAAPAESQTLDDVGPIRGAHELRSVRETAPQPVMRFRAREGEDGGCGDARVTMGDSYIAIVCGDRQRLYDLRLKRLLEVDQASNSVANISLFTLPALKSHQFDVEIRKAQGKPGYWKSVRPQAVDPALANRVAAGMNYRDDDFRVPKTTTESVDDAVHRISSDSGAVRATLSDMAWEDGDAKLFRRYLRYRLSLAPELSDAIARLPRLPIKIDRREDDGWTALWSASDAKRTEAPYPLPADAHLTHAHLPKILQDLVPTLEQQVADGLPAPQRPADLMPAIEAAEARGDWVSVYLISSATSVPNALTCRGLARDAVTCTDLLRKRRQAMEADDRLRQIKSVIARVPDDPDRYMAALETLVGLDLSELDHAYRLETAMARMISAAERREDINAEAVAKMAPDPEALFARALKARPSNAIAFRDFGDFYYTRGDKAAAWFLYDIGRMIVPAGKRSRLRIATEIEGDLLRKQPGFF